MRILLHLFTFCFLLTSVTNIEAATCTSVANGNWASGGTWSCGRKPNCGDTVYINHVVTIAASEDYTGCTSPMFIVINAGGRMHFNNGRKLRLPCSSGVSLMPASGATPAGTITANGYTGNSESLQICGNVAWQAADGQANGPLVFGSGLPVEFLSFDAYWSNKNVHLNWATATETNNDYFMVQKSSNGLVWEDIIQTVGAGNSNSIINYFEIDYFPFEDLNYYRIKQVDYDGRENYSPIEVVRSYNQLSGELNLYPNPCDGFFHLQLSVFGDEDYIIMIRDITGRESYSKIITTSANTHMETINLSGVLAAGSYIVTVSNRNASYSQKLVVK